MRKLCFTLLVFAGLLSSLTAAAGGYLFAHTGHGDGKYYHLYYAFSEDGKDWKVIPGEPLPEYFGFPYITEAAEGGYVLIGTSSGARPHHPVVWFSSDLLSFTRKDLPATVLDVPEDYENDTNSYGAVKIFYDRLSAQYMLTWHASLKAYPKGNNHWKSMRTFYVLTRDFETFTPARRLFDFSGMDEYMATIDVSIHHYDGQYYAVIKDERWKDLISDRELYPKSVRIAHADSLTGPYSNPGTAVAPKWREAPTLVRAADGSFLLYVEDYRHHQYELYRSPNIERSGLWQAVPVNLPEGARHGCVIPLSDELYRSLQERFGF